MVAAIAILLIGVLREELRHLYRENAEIRREVERLDMARVIAIRRPDSTRPSRDIAEFPAVEAVTDLHPRRPEPED